MSRLESDWLVCPKVFFFPQTKKKKKEKGKKLMGDTRKGTSRMHRSFKECKRNDTYLRQLNTFSLFGVRRREGPRVGKVPR